MIFYFFEQIEFTELTEEKLREFLSSFDFNQTTNSLWEKFYQCFFIHFNKRPERNTNHQHSIKKETYDYDENTTNRFNGIIDHLITQFGCNVVDQGICKATASSIFEEIEPSSIIDYSNDDISFSTKIQRNSWIKFDFIDRKVHPTYYSIRT